MPAKTKKQADQMNPELENTASANLKYYEFNTGQTGYGKRADAFLSENLADEGISREKIKKAIIGGFATINGQPLASAGRKLTYNETVGISLPDISSQTVAEAAELNVLYDDQQLVILNKQAGLTVHPCPSCPDGTLVNRLLSHFPALREQGGERPGIVHRLDKDTSGLIMIAKDEKTRLTLAEGFANRLVKKEYLALVYGVPEREQASIALPIGRHDSNKTKMAVQPKGGREALSEYRVLYADPERRFSLLAVKIHTGRTHQIRVHLSHIGFPLVGDFTYYDSRKVVAALGLDLHGEALRDFMRDIAPRQLLHAWRLQFTHPETGEELSFCCPPPNDFYSAVLKLSNRVQKIVLTGNPGCGKSTVLKMLAEKGMPVWSADAAVRSLYKAGAAGWHMLKGRYGSRFVDEDNADAGVNKKALFEAMCAEPHLRREVEALIHPLVQAQMQHFWDTHSKIGSADITAVAEVPLYFESRHMSSAQVGNKAKAQMEEPPVVIGVQCPYEQRLKRLCGIRGWSTQMAELMESWQMPENKKMQAADFIIDNSKGLSRLEGELPEIINKISRLHTDKHNKLKALLQSLTSCE